MNVGGGSTRLAERVDVVTRQKDEAHEQLETFTVKSKPAMTLRPTNAQIVPDPSADGPCYR